LEVSTSGFYAGRRRIHPGHKERKHDALVVRVRTIHEQVRGSYGSRRMARELCADGCQVGRYRARSLMRQACIHVRRRRRSRATTDSRHASPVAANRLDRQFTRAAPNQAWGSDITYLWTKQGWLYLAIVIDLYSRRVVGWALAEHMRFELVHEALTMALWRRRPPPALLHHSDRGSQYACERYQQVLQNHAMTPSMSRKGNCWDNAPVERFFGSLKRECTDLKCYVTRQEAKADVIDSIEMFYNCRRRHSTLGYISPMEFEAMGNVA